MTLLLILPRLASANDTCAAWEHTSSATVTVDDVGESSGVAVGPSTGILYTLEDAGNDAVLHIVGTDGAYLGAQTVRGATNTDWEDLAAARCPSTVDAEGCLWIADTGDNDETRDEVVLWVVPESTRATEDAVACRLGYPGGRAYDVEALLVAPDGVVRLVTKENDGEARVFVGGPLRCDGTLETLSKEAVLDVAAPVTGGAMSADGTTAVLRTRDEALVWRGCDVDWSVAPERVPLPVQEQGEGIALTADGDLVTSSEGEPFRAWVGACVREEPVPCEAPGGCGCGTGTAPGAFSVAVLAVAAALGRRYRRGNR